MAEVKQGTEGEGEGERERAREMEMEMESARRVWKMKRRILRWPTWKRGTQGYGEWEWETERERERERKRNREWEFKREWERQWKRVWERVWERRRERENEREWEWERGEGEGEWKMESESERKLVWEWQWERERKLEWEWVWICELELEWELELELESESERKRKLEWQWERKRKLEWQWERKRKLEWEWVWICELELEWELETLGRARLERGEGEWEMERRILRWPKWKRGTQGEGEGGWEWEWERERDMKMARAWERLWEKRIQDWPKWKGALMIDLLNILKGLTAYTVKRQRVRDRILRFHIEMQTTFEFLSNVLGTELWAQNVIQDMEQETIRLAKFLDDDAFYGSVDSLPAKNSSADAFYQSICLFLKVNSSSDPFDESFSRSGIDYESFSDVFIKSIRQLLDDDSPFDAFHLSICRLLDYNSSSHAFYRLIYWVLDEDSAPNAVYEMLRSFLHDSSSSTEWEYDKDLDHALTAFQQGISNIRNRIDNNSDLAPSEIPYVEDLYRVVSAVEQRIAEIRKHMDAFNESVGWLLHVSSWKFDQNLDRVLSAVEHRITEIGKQMHVFCAYHISIPQFQDKDSSSTEGRRNGPVLKEPHMVGREAEFEKLLDSLIEGGLQLTVIPIVGDGGEGKTTLAAKAYNNVYIKNYFEYRAWVYVSSEYKQEQMLEAILKGIVPLSVLKKGMVANELKATLRKYLADKRFVIVLDDVLHSDPWKHLSQVLPDDKNGSRVLITTRNVYVAVSLCPREHRVELRQLNKKGSWELLCKKVFGDGICASPELKLVGERMVHECHGWALAIMLLGGLLSKKEKRVLVWEKVQSDLLPNARPIMLSLGEIISYSVADLPYLRPCFIYFCVFPKGREIPTRHLFQLWIAEGFIRENSEAIAEEYLEELIDRCLIQAVRRTSDGKIKTCRIHDFPFEKSHSLAMESNMLHVPKTRHQSESLNSCKRLSVHSDPEIISSKFHSPFMRSLLCTTADKSHLPLDGYNSICRRFKLLRVLDLGAIVCDHLPDAIEYPSLLRYLRLNVPSLDSIPSKLCNLTNLYTLDLPSSHINHVPHDIWKMQSLRNLYFSFIRLPGHPNSMTDCDLLRDLNFISTLCPSSCTHDILGRLPNLQTLRICGDLSSHHEALSNNLSNLHCLEFLKMVGDANLTSMVLSELQFPPSLTNLTLSNTGLRDDPMPTLEKLPNLQVLKLKHNSYRGRKLVCSSGGFPLLQVLHLKSMRWLEEWSMEKGAMAHLVCLVINPCAYLRRLPEDLWHLKSFSKLELWWPRPELKPRLLKIEDMGRYDVQIYPYGL